MSDPNAPHAPHAPHSPHDVKQRRMKLLLAWGVGSVVLGVPTFWLGPVVAAAGSQFVIWGAIDALIALPGLRRDDGLDPAKLLETLEFSRKLNYLWLAIGLGLLIGGIWLPVLIGHGVGVLVQGGFLFGFDRGFHRDLSAAA